VLGFRCSHLDVAEARQFVTDTLGLATADRLLRRTPRVFIAEQFNIPKAADRLFAHRNTIDGRVVRVDELLPTPLGDNPAAVDAALALVERQPGDDARHADLRVDADVVQADITAMSDRIDGIDQLVAECFSRPDTLPPWVVSCAAGDAMFADLFRFDCLCIAGLAASEQLDMASAEDHFGEGLLLATTAEGQHSYTARLAAALLGDLLYERGEIDDAERLLDVAQELGAENGSVDIMIAR
jgi:hypothetical protein